MKRFNSIKKNDEFRRIYKNGKSYANKYIVMYIYENEGQTNRIGISVSKKVGNSVVRHRLTRLIREVFRLNEDYLKKGYDIIVIVRNNSKDLDYKKMESAYLHLCKLHNILNWVDYNEKNTDFYYKVL